MTLAYKLCLVAASFLLSAVGGPSVFAHPQSNSRAAVEIRTVLNRQVESWNKRDLEGFMQGYWRSGELSFFSGATKLNGWQATLERYQKKYQSEGRDMGHLEFLEIDVRPLGGSDAFVRGRWQLRLQAETIGGLFTLIFHRFDNGWRIIHDHTSSSGQ